MVSFTLTGTGVQSLSASVVALHVSVTALPLTAGNGLANPLDHYGVGLIRPGDSLAFWDAYPITGGPQWLPLPFGTIRLGYALVTGGQVTVDEVFAPAPLAFPLASLPDVALSSPSNGQALTYQASSSKWINSTPAGGGGSGRTKIYDNTIATPLPLPLATGWATLLDGDLLDVEVYGALQPPATGWNTLTFQIGDASGLKTSGYGVAYPPLSPSGNAGVQAPALSQATAGDFLNANSGGGTGITPGMSFAHITFYDAGGSLPHKAWLTRTFGDYNVSAGVATALAGGHVVCGPITQIQIRSGIGGSFVAGTRVRVYVTHG